jgi:hypothetical protein
MEWMGILLPIFVVVVVLMGGFDWGTSMFFPNLLCKMIGEMECTQVSQMSIG